MMGSDVIIFPEPGIDCNLRLFDTVEPFSVEDFFSQGAVQTLVMSYVGKTVSRTVF